MTTPEVKAYFDGAGIERAGSEFIKPKPVTPMHGPTNPGDTAAC